MQWIGEAALWEQLHCLPSELDAEAAEDVLRAMHFLSAKATYQARRQAMNNAQADLSSMPGG